MIINTYVIQVSFIILSGDVMIPCCCDVTVGGEAPEFFNFSIFTHFFAHYCCVGSCNWQKVAKKVTSNILKSSLVPTTELI